MIMECLDSLNLIVNVESPPWMMRDFPSDLQYGRIPFDASFLIR
jgi:hypothetical protein